MKIRAVLFAVSLASALGSEAGLSRRHRRSHRLRRSLAGAPSAAPASSPTAANPPPPEPAFGAAEFGPKECVTTWPNPDGQCMIETDCVANDIQDFDFAIECVDSSGGAVVHSFGRGSFRPKETFNTMASCQECRPAAGGGSAKAAVLSLESVVSTLKGQMVSMQEQLQTLETQVRAPPAMALSGEATDKSMENSPNADEAESTPQDDTEKRRAQRPAAAPVQVVQRRGHSRQFLADERKQWQQEEQEDRQVAERQREQDEAHDQEQDEDDERADAARASGSAEEPDRECGGPDELCGDGLDHRDLYQKEQDAIWASKPGYLHRSRKPARQHGGMPAASPTLTRHARKHRGVRGFSKKQLKWRRGHKAIVDAPRARKHRKQAEQREQGDADQRTEATVWQPFADNEAPLPEHVLVHRRARRRHAQEERAQVGDDDANQAEAAQSIARPGRSSRAPGFAADAESEWPGAQGTEDQEQLRAEPPQPRAGDAPSDAEPEAASEQQLSAYQTAPEPEGEMSAAYQEVPADEANF